MSDYKEITDEMLEAYSKMLDEQEVPQTDRWFIDEHGRLWEQQKDGSFAVWSSK